jgi:surface protein
MKSINIKITNNTSFNQDISILGIIPNPNSANDSNNLYSFDLSTQIFVLVNSVSITYASTSNPTPTTLTASVLVSSIQGVVDALNTLGIGLFNYSGTTIYVSSSIYTYSNITIGFPFVSTWNTTNTSGGSSASNQVALPLFSTGVYNFIVDWGDGNTDTITAWNQAEVTHTYTTAGTYIISIDGVCKGFRFNNTGDRLKILSVTSWGDFELIGNLGRQFYGCTNLDLASVSDVLNFGNCTNCEYMFDSYQFATINNINSWNLSNVTNMTFMFNNSLFNQDLSSWNVGSVTNMSNMFESALAFNGNISTWNVSSVQTMNSMFRGATSFNQSLNSWNVGSVTTMGNMFFSASSFNGNISAWNVSSVINMGNMFRTSPFNQNISSWDVSNVSDMSSMFRNSPFNQNIGSWNVSSVTTMENMFSNSSFNQNINSWDVSSVTIMGRMFSGTLSFNQSLNSWNVSGVVTMDAMFSGASAFNGNISSWNVSNVALMNNMFQDATTFNQNIGGWNVVNVQNMSSMFSLATAFNQNIGSWNIINVTNFTNFMQGKTFTNYSSANLDAIYNGWSLLAVQPNLTINFGTIKYTAGASAGRLVLTSAPNNWIITDGGI